MKAEERGSKGDKYVLGRVCVCVCSFCNRPFATERENEPEAPLWIEE